MAKKRNFQMDYDEDSRTLIGVVYEFGNDQDSMGLMIVTEEDEEYLVVLDHEGEKLWDFIDEEVIVTGLISEDEKGSLHISVRHIETVDYDDDDDGDDDYWDDDDDL